MMRACALAALCAISSALLFYPSVHFGFSYDDKTAVMANPDVNRADRGLHWTKMILNDFWGNPLLVSPVCSTAHLCWTTGSKPVWGEAIHALLASTFGECAEAPFSRLDEDEWRSRACEEGGTAMNSTHDAPEENDSVPAHRAKSWTHLSWRPVVVASLRADVMLAGYTLNPYVMHRTNVIIYMVACAIAAWSMYEIVEAVHAASGVRRVDFRSAPLTSIRHMVPILSGLIFAVHSIHTEVVANVTTRAEPICGGLVLLACAMYARLRTKPSRKRISRWSTMAQEVKTFVLVLIVTLLASTTKETGIILPALLCCIEGGIGLASAVHHAQLKGTGVRGAAKRMWTLVSLRVVVLAVAFVVVYTLRIRFMLGGYDMNFRSFDNYIANHPDAASRARSIAYIVAFCLALCVYPFRQSYNHGSLKPVESPLDSRNCFTVVVMMLIATLIGTVVTSLTSVLASPHSGNRSSTQIAHLATVATAFAFACVAYAPASHLFVRTSFVVAERTLFLPSFGMSVIVSTAVGALSVSTHHQVPSLSRLGWFWSIGTLLLAAHVSQTQAFLPTWASDETITRQDLVSYPHENVLSTYYQAVVHTYSGDFAGALPYALNVTRWDPTLKDAFALAAQLYMRVSDDGDMDPTLATRQAVEMLTLAFTEPEWKYSRFKTNLGVLEQGLPDADLGHANLMILTAAARPGKEVPKCQHVTLASNAACARLLSDSTQFGRGDLALGFLQRATSIVFTEADAADKCTARVIALWNTALFWVVQGARRDAERALSGLDVVLRAGLEAGKADAEKEGEEAVGPAGIRHHLRVSRLAGMSVAVERMIRALASPRLRSLLAMWSADRMRSGLVAGQDARRRITLLQQAVSPEWSCMLEQLWY